LLGPGARAPSPTGPSLEPGLAAALAAVERGDGTCDSVATELRVSGAEAALAVARLELLGYVECSPLGSYTRTLLAAPDHAPAGRRS